MQTLLFSEVDAKRENRGWYRVGHHINYSEYKPRTYNSLLERDINYFELDFQFVRNRKFVVVSFDLSMIFFFRRNFHIRVIRVILHIVILIHLRI